jgi:formate dehydrogenase major subunit
VDIGSNMAENHPVGFQWVMEARLGGAKVIHVDPRYTRTSAVSNMHVPIRAGTDIAFLGGIINYILENGRYFEEYVKAYTNAPVIINQDFADTEDLDGLFSGWDPETCSYDTSTWEYAGMSASGAAGQREQGGATGEQAHYAQGGELEHGMPPERDETLRHPRCVFQLLKKHYRRYTPEMVENVCGVAKDHFLQVCEEICRNSGRERTASFVYSVGWTQHTHGVQNIRAAAIIQLLLGNIGRPGGGIMALRGHASIQGSTDIPTLFNILPGYIPMPHAHQDLDTFVERNSAPSGYWGNMEAYTVSLLKAWWGDAATAENDYCFDHLPRLTSDHSIYPAIMGMVDGWCKGFFVMGQNPAVGAANGKLQRLALANLDWLVVRDLVETETAAFWYDSPEVETGELKPEDIRTEVFFLPAAAHTEKEGSFTNTQRLLQWRNKAVGPKGDCRSELWFMYHLGKRIQEKLANSDDPKDRAVLDLKWGYPTRMENGVEEPDAHAVLREINGWDENNEALSTYLDIKDDGSTSCGCWIYCGVFADEQNQANRRKSWTEQPYVAPEWGWAWPANRRILYNRASADPEGKPWSERKKYVWWDEEKGQWTGKDVPDFAPTKRPDYVPPDDARAQDAIRGDKPFIMQADGTGWLYVPAGLTDGPLPTHYEPHESPFDNELYGQRSNPARERFLRIDNPYNPSGGQPGSGVFPYILSTYRLTEHHTAGGMSRSTEHLSELMPEMFCEVSPELAQEVGLENGGWATIVTTRTAIEARVLLTDRLAPLKVQGRKTYLVGMPYHWGKKGIVTGDSANDLLGLALDPNVHIGEYKVSTCDIRPGRRPRGPALVEFVESYRRRAGVPYGGDGS